ncbi:MAG TPA: TlpA disulfide reductase family protein [Rhodanobacteraceae bacterium]|nr:TlpA disulfide reductase family protein [Rhodanobacteraceae bacterium]
MKAIYRNRRRSGALFLVVVASLMLTACSQPAEEATPATAPASTASKAPASGASRQGAFTLAASGLSAADGTTVQLSALMPGADGQWNYGTVAQTTVTAGAFQLNGATTAVVPAVLSVGVPGAPGYSEASLILEGASYRVHPRDGVLEVAGGRYNDVVFGYTRLPAYVQAVKAKDAAEREAYKNVDHSDEKAMLAAKMASAPTVAPFYMAISKVAGDYLTPIVNGDGDDLLKFFALSFNPDWEQFPPQRREALMQGWSQSLADSPAYRSDRAAAAEEAKATAIRDAFAVGAMYHDITATDRDGREVKLSDVLAKNRFVLLDFWASWCAPCREEFPHLAKVYADYHDAGFEIYGVSLDEGREDWLKAMKQESDNGHLPWINLRANGFASAAAQAYGVRALPNNYLIARDGRIVGKELRGADVERIVAEQLGKTGHGQD